MGEEQGYQQTIAINEKTTKDYILSPDEQEATQKLIKLLTPVRRAGAWADGRNIHHPIASRMARQQIASAPARAQQRLEPKYNITVSKYAIKRGVTLEDVARSNDRVLLDTCVLGNTKSLCAYLNEVVPKFPHITTIPEVLNEWTGDDFIAYSDRKRLLHSLNRTRMRAHSRGREYYTLLEYLTPLARRCGIVNLSKTYPYTDVNLMTTAVWLAGQGYRTAVLSQDLDMCDFLQYFVEKAGRHSEKRKGAALLRVYAFHTYNAWLLPIQEDQERRQESATMPNWRSKWRGRRLVPAALKRSPVLPVGFCIGDTVWDGAKEVPAPRTGLPHA